MKKKLLVPLILFSILSTLNAQVLTRFISFEEDSDSFSMHLCSDGKSYYTVNGGDPKAGKIFTYSLKGELIKSYPLPLDMRGIMYNKKTKSIYVNTLDKKIFRIIDLSAGTYELVFADLYEQEQSSLALDPNGKFLYAFDNGNLSIFKFKKGVLDRTLSGLKCGKSIGKGAAAVAIDKKYIYTWDSDSKVVYAYDKKGAFKKSFILRDGDFGYSLSYANGMIFVSHSEQNKKGNWYGYYLWGMNQ
ncbi:MAG: hypothetical protein KAQ62_02130 [Cyclobacteriaceae bacterium]|nr:hypothetical protein [Cyclobacteriaceae bacterium]MCK5367310.1 hypothetical protein [Cyclobacteriaceae bacterium]MCK5467218.1 hypothetical protein [Cyclobacteriaceae bacterium]